MPWTSSDIQLKEIGVHKNHKYDDKGLWTLSKLFEYKPTRNDSDKYFRCFTTIDNSIISQNADANERLSISEQFRVEYPPTGIGIFAEVQRSGRQQIITLTKGENANINIEFDACPLPSRGWYKNILYFSKMTNVHHILPR